MGVFRELLDYLLQLGAGEVGVGGVNEEAGIGIGSDLAQPRRGLRVAVDDFAIGREQSR
jgi:hypothetical protein